MKLQPLIPVKKGSKKTYLPEWSTLPWGELAKEVKKNNGGNVGLRLDLYFALDPDCPEAEKFCNELDANGELPSTVTWKTWRGHTVRLFNPPPGRNHKPLKIESPFELELRTGNGQLCVIPNSTVFDPETKQSGKYQWVSGHSPDEIDVADFPPDLHERLIAMAAKPTSDRPAAQQAPANRSLSFEQGGRDNALYSTALFLRKGGMNEADLSAVIELLAAGCNPPFPPREAIRKVQAAFKATPAERNLAQEIKDFIDCSSGVFSTAELDRELGLSQKNEKDNRRKIISRLIADGVIQRDPNRNGLFLKPNQTCETLDPWNGSEQKEYRLIWPFNIHEYCYLYPQSIAVVAGAKDAGKTAMLLNLALMNHIHQVTYFNSEMAAGELGLRLSKFDYGREAWKHVEWIGNYNSQAVEYLIRPDNLNIIDYLEEPEKVWTLGAQISRIRQKLTTGIAIVGLQKDRKKDVARGGEATMQKSRIYLTLDNGEAKLVSGKLWRTPGVNPKDKIWRYKLVDGCKFVIS